MIKNLKQNFIKFLQNLLFKFEYLHGKHNILTTKSFFFNQNHEKTYFALDNNNKNTGKNFSLDDKKF